MTISKMLYFKNPYINQCIDNYMRLNENNRCSATKASNINDNMKQMLQNLIYFERYWKFWGLFPPHFLKLCEQSLSSNATLGWEK